MGYSAGGNKCLPVGSKKGCYTPCRVFDKTNASAILPLFPSAGRHNLKHLQVLPFLREVAANALKPLKSLLALHSMRYCLELLQYNAAILGMLSKVSHLEKYILLQEVDFMLHPKMKHVYVGLDIHRRTHTASIINCFGENLGSITFENRPPEFEKLVREVRRHTPKGISPIYGLEDVVAPGRALAVFLINRKQAVKYVNPTLTYSERKNQTILHKTDEFDSLCIARVLLNRLDELPDANPQDIYRTLSQLVSRRNALVKNCTALKKQLQTYVMYNYPSYYRFFSIFDGKAALEFWETYPSPLKLKNIGVQELGEFLHQHTRGYYGEGKAEEILHYIVEDGNTLTDYQEMRDYIISSAVRQLKTNIMELNENDKRIAELLPLFGYKLQSMKGISQTTAAALIAEIGDINRFANADKLAKYAGVSPVAYSSGRTDKFFSNRRGDRKLNRIFFNLAVTLVNKAGGKKVVNQAFYDYYRRKQAEGKTKNQALKCVMRRLVTIIYRMMKNKTEYIQPELPEKEKE